MATLSANPVQFLQEVRTELSKVRWPTRSETIRLTIVVIAVSIVVGAFIGALDAVLLKITETFLR